MSIKKRLFIGIDLPPGLKESIALLIREARGGERDRRIRWVAPAKQHLTLKFLGETDDEKIPGILGAMAEAAQPVLAEPLEIRSAGVFPDTRRPRVLWLDVRDPSAWLQPFAVRLEQALEAQGFAREHRPFVAHLTLARLERKLPEGMLESLMQTDVGKFVPFELVLYESRPAPFRDYLALGSVPLKTSQTAFRSSSPSGESASSRN